MGLPLEGIRVLDLTRLLPGAYCTMLLADMGAEVIKIENPKDGDHFRWVEPLSHGKSVLFDALNRNKKSMKLNLKNPTGVKLFNELAKKADVVFESFRPGVLDRLGVGYDALKKINAGIIFCSLSGFGQGGPYLLKPGHDLNYISIGGLQGLNGRRGGELVPPAIQIADIGCGAANCAISILAALVGRKQSGDGQYIDVAMLDGVVSWMSMAITQYHEDHKIPESGNMTFTGAHASYNIYKTKDSQYVSLGCVEEKFWVNFCEAIGRPDLGKYHMPNAKDKRLEVIQEVSGIMLTKTRDEWCEILDGVETCFAPVKTIPETMADPQVQHRKLIVEMDHPKGGKTVQIACPIRFSKESLSMRTPPPEFGEHVTEILSELGYSMDDIKAFEAEGAI